MSLDMSPYVDQRPSGEGGVANKEGGGAYHYDLFSVVVHSGSTHSGHYTAYIKDIDALGSWKNPVSTQNSYTQDLVRFFA